MKKQLPIGIDDFKKIITQNYYYIDKSLFIKEVLDSGAAGTLIPRPRRFGKTLNMSMLRYFFEKADESTSHLFDGLAITKHQDVMDRQGQYPVIFLTFKGANTKTWDTCFESLKWIVTQEYERHSYLSNDSLLNETQKKAFKEIISGQADLVTYQLSLKNLTEYLAKYHKKNPIILIDEYDVPIHTGFINDYFPSVISFMKTFLGEGIKGNSFLNFAVITGALRVAKESIFTGFNNLEVCTLLDTFYEDKFGLLEKEVIELLAYYDLQTNIDDVRSWYNGYTSGKVTVYNPWSIINLVKRNGALQPYWINTSSNDIIKTLLTGDNGAESSLRIEEDIATLIARKSITKEISENIVYEDVKKNSNALWNFLFFSGYLTFKNQRLIDKRPSADFLIPNDEVGYFFESTILAWIKERAGEHEYNDMLKSLVTGDIDTFRKLFCTFVLTSFSYFDISGKKPEKFYHAFVLGMLVSLTHRYAIRSNRESGYGRYDVMLIPHDTTKLGIIIEFKKVDTYENETLEQAVTSALTQIEAQKYAQEIRAHGVNSIISIGIAFSGKNVLIQAKQS